MVEKSTNSVILYPVKDRTADTLIPLIERHLEKGSTIYSNGFSAYFHLNDMGYRHFTVIHKYSFKKTYKNAGTGEIKVVHTNRIEGAWKHAKVYFRKMSGTKASQWEGHMVGVSKYN
jgi:transposase-like protein